MNIKTRHLKQERQTWLRTLDYIQVEHVLLKNYLSDILKNDITAEVLEEVEYFQSQFINNDAVIALLRRDIAGLSKPAEFSLVADTDFTKLYKKQGKLRADIELMELGFIRLKFKFHNYFAAAL